MGVALGIFIASVGAGCASSAPRPFLPEFYSTPKLTALPTPLPTLSVHRFVDERPGAAEPTMVYKFDSISAVIAQSAFSKMLNEVRATEPVAVGVARAVVQGLGARGVPVIDMTVIAFEPGRASGTARLAISGRVLAFGVQVIRSGLYEYRSVTGCRIALEAYEAGSGQKLWENTYSRQEEATSRTLASAAPANHWPGLSTALAAVIEQALSDPQLLELLR